MLTSLAFKDFTQGGFIILRAVLFSSSLWYAIEVSSLRALLAFDALPIAYQYLHVYLNT